MTKTARRQIAAVCLGSLLLFCSLALWLTAPDTLVGVSVPKQDEPYVAPTDYPPDATVLMAFPDGYTLVVELRFQDGKGRAALLDAADESQADVYGFTVAYHWSCDYAVLAELIDTIGGIPFTENGETFYETGVQVVRRLSENLADSDLRCRMLTAVFEKIHQTGFPCEALSCIIEKGKTDLSVPACFGWTDHLPRVCGGLHLINEG